MIAAKGSVHLWLVVATAAVLVGAACGSEVTTRDDDSSSGSSASSTSSSSASSSSSSGQAPSCGDLCVDLVAADCADGPDAIDECTAGCEATAVLCPHETEAVFACGGSPLTILCQDGQAVPEGCATEQAVAIACLQAATKRCRDSCPAVVAAGCPEGPPEQSDCEKGCRNATFDCPAELDAVFDCAGTSPTFACDGSGVPVPQGCAGQQQTLLACLANN